MIASPAERRSEALQEAERQQQMSPDEHPLDGAEGPGLDPSIATLSGIIAACFGLTVLALAWWPL
jgi:hypothetical protein